MMSSSDLERLIAAWLDGRISSEESQALQQQLRDSADARAAFIGYAQLDAVLRKMADTSGAFDLPPPVEQVPVIQTSAPDCETEIGRKAHQTSATPSRSALGSRSTSGIFLKHRIWHRIWLLPVGIAALLMFALALPGIFPLGGTMSSFFSFQHKAPAPPLAAKALAGRVVDLVDVTWSEGASRYKKWSRLSIGDSVRFKTGVVELLLENGAQIVLEGPAYLRLESPKKAIALRGKLIVRCGPEAAGYEVESPHAKVIDLGTEFGMTVVEGMRTDVVVYEGAVDLSTRTGAESQEFRLIAGEALQIDLYGEIEYLLNRYRVELRAFLRWLRWRRLAMGVPIVD